MGSKDEEREALEAVREIFPELPSDRRHVNIARWVILGVLMVGFFITLAQWVWPGSRPLWRLSRLWLPLPVAAVVVYLFAQIIELQHLVWNVIKLLAEKGGSISARQGQEERQENTGSAGR